MPLLFGCPGQDPLAVGSAPFYFLKIFLGADGHVYFLRIFFGVDAFLFFQNNFWGNPPSTTLDHTPIGWICATMEKSLVFRRVKPQDVVLPHHKILYLVV